MMQSIGSAAEVPGTVAIVQRHMASTMATMAIVLRHMAATMATDSSHVLQKALVRQGVPTPVVFAAALQRRSHDVHFTTAVFLREDAASEAGAMAGVADAARGAADLAETPLAEETCKLVWRVHGLELEEVPAESQGRFCSGDSYVVEHRQGTSRHLAVWHGLEASMQQRALAAWHMTLSRPTTQTVMTQGEESHAFRSLFGGEIHVVPGDPHSVLHNPPHVEASVVWVGSSGRPRRLPTRLLRLLMKLYNSIEEKRLDDDGMAYTRTQFAAFYGGAEKWEQAPQACDPWRRIAGAIHVPSHRNKLQSWACGGARSSEVVCRLSVCGGSQGLAPAVRATRGGFLFSGLGGGYVVGFWKRL